MVRIVFTLIAMRVAAVIPVVVILSFVVFVVLRLLPADPLGMLLPPNATAEDAERIKAALGLDKSIISQFGIWLLHAAWGDLGTSISFREPVSSLIAATLPATLELSLVAIVFSLAISVPSGLWAYAARGTVTESVIELATITVLSIPSFLWGLILMLVFGVWWGALPFSGRIESTDVVTGGTGFLLYDLLRLGRFSDWLDALRHIFLPASALALGFSPFIVRVLKTSLIDEADAHYVMVARLRGLSTKDVILKHMLKNAALPTITLIGAQFGFLFGGTLLVETIFSFPGMGNLMVQAVRNHDLPIVQAVAIVFCIIIQLINATVDILYVVLNPKLRIPAAAS